MAHRRLGDLPKPALSSHTQVLQDEPYSDLVLGICESGGARHQASDEIARVHAIRWLRSKVAAHALVG
jgi:hypothetical protein